MKEKIRTYATELGFDLFRVASPHSIAASKADLKAYLRAGYHGDMAWMKDRAEKRANPALLWPDVRSVLVFGMNYGPDYDPLHRVNAGSRGLVSAYAQGIDYHDVIKPKLKRIAAFIAKRSGGQAKVFVDTAPVMEKPLAAAAGLGWQGKHTVLASREFGSWLFLGVVFTDVALEPDAAGKNHCGSCRSCLDICPTSAFPAPYRLDSRKCIAYLTIEHKGPIPRELRAKFGNRIFGCDDCLAVCPWNKFARQAREHKLTSRRDIGLMPLAELLRLDDASFCKLFAKTPVKRTGRERFIRNCLIAAGNSGDANLIAPVRALLDDQSPLVRGAAVWALAQLSDQIIKEESQRSNKERNPEVCEEWAAALNLQPAHSRASGNPENPAISNPILISGPPLARG